MKPKDPHYSHRQRADNLLVDQGLAVSRALAQALILEGRVYQGNRRLEKPGTQVAKGTALWVSPANQYVGRGGKKLAPALTQFGLNLTGIVALDIGASTGGFTDCLLQFGAQRVYAVDAGYGQLAASLRQDQRVVSMERTNARLPLSIPEPIDLIVADVSFISLRLVLPNNLEHLIPEGYVLVLVKPQFEADRRLVGGGGVIRDPIVQSRVVGSFCVWAINYGLRIRGIRLCSLKGGSGNQEYFVLMQRIA